MVVLLTGATGGIGVEISKCLIEKEYDLILVGRDQTKLNRLMQTLDDGKSQINSICVDLREEESAYKIWERVQTKKIKVDILINAAGFGLYGDFVEQKSGQNYDLLDVNLKSMITLCNLFGKQMKQRKSGYIINFSSISAFFPGKYMASYYASKAYVLSFSIALAEELKKDNVKVLAICPDVIHTQFYKKASADQSYSYLLNRMPPLSTQVFAKKAMRVIQKKKTHYVIIGIRAKILVFLSHFIPKRLLVKMIGWIQAKKK